MGVGTLEFGGKQWEYSWWDGQLLKGTAERPISVDLETRAMAPARAPVGDETLEDVPPHPLDVPEAALGMVCDHEQLYLIHPSKLDKFVLAHKQQHWAGQNLAFDFWILMKHTKSPQVKEALWSLGDTGRLHDTLVQDLLLQLASGVYRYAGKAGGDDPKIYPANLAILSAEWEVGELSKTDPYRLRFGELLGKSEKEIEQHPEFEGFASYALKDVLAVYGIWPKQRAASLMWMHKCGWSPTKKKGYEIRPDALEKFGPLSEKIQVQASIVLAELSRTPIRVDQERRKRMESECRARYQSSLDLMLAREPELVKKSPEKWVKAEEGEEGAVLKKVLYRGKEREVWRKKVKDSEVLYTSKTGVPQFDQKKLIEVLKVEAERLGIKPLRVQGGKSKEEICEPGSKVKKLVGVISTSAKDWKIYGDRSEFIRAWASLEGEVKHLQFLRAIDAPYIYSRYDLMKATGRTSAGTFYDYKKKLLLPSLNIQQVPRDDPKNPDDNLRPLFLAPEGMEWCAIDYSYLEFRAMAAVARARYGYSVMADITEKNTLQGGPDPHQALAASMLGLSIDEFFALDKDTQKINRQYSKLGNFGLMSGMSKETFVDYAKSQGANLTHEQAGRVKKAFMDTYKEMQTYLDSDLSVCMEWGCKEGTKFPYKLNGVQKHRFVKFLKQDKPGQSNFTAEEQELFWDILEWAAFRKGDDAVLEDVNKRKITGRVRKLTYYRAATLTGLIRNFTTYTAERNTNFQSIAASGAKLALWNLMRNGMQLINFVHDEIGVAVPKGSAKTKQKYIEKVMVDSMQNVLGEGVPVAVSGESSSCWSKG